MGRNGSRANRRFLTRILLPSASNIGRTKIARPRIWHFCLAFGVVDVWTSVSFRCRSRYLPGSAKRSGERGKRSRGHTTTTPKAPPKPPNAAKYPLCSPSPRRTRHNPPSLHRTVSPDTRPAVKSTPPCRFDPPKRFLFHRCGGDFSLSRQRKVGAASPPGEAGPSPVPAPWAGPLRPLRKRRKGLVLVPPSGPSSRA